MNRALVTTAFAAALIAAFALRIGAQDPCARLEHETRLHLVNSKDKVQRVTLSDQHCRIDVELRGSIGFTADFRGIATMERGDRFMLEERAGRATRRLVVDGGAGGMEYDYRVDGQRRDIDSGVQAWLADRLLLLYRHSDLAAEERARWILSQGGLDALIAEAAKNSSSSGQASYLAIAMEHPDMSSSRMATLLRDALPSSSSQQAVVLRMAVARRPMEPQLVDGILAALRQVSSSSTQREILTAALAADAPRPLVLGAVNAARYVSSTAAKREILLMAASTHAFDEALLSAYLSVAGDISSSSASRDVLLALLAREELGERQLARVIRASTGISSSTSRADVLTAAAAKRTLTGEARDAYLEAAGSITSSSQRARVLEALLAQGR